MNDGKFIAEQDRLALGVQREVAALSLGHAVGLDGGVEAEVALRGQRARRDLARLDLVRAAARLDLAVGR